MKETINNPSYTSISQGMAMKSETQQVKVTVRSLRSGIYTIFN